nr:hypothetical protein [uncultured Dysosmobacter sp.]
MAQFFFITVVLFYFFYIRPQLEKVEEQRAEQERQKREGKRLRDEIIRREMEKSKEKMHSHPLLEAVESNLILTIDTYIQRISDKKISSTSSDVMYISFLDTALKIRTTYANDKIITYSAYGYDLFKSQYDLQAFKEVLYMELLSHYINVPMLTWNPSESSFDQPTMSIDFTACHPKLKNI